MGKLGVFVQKRLYSDFFIIKRKSDGSGVVATYYKAKVESVIGCQENEIIHFGQMVAKNDEVIIKRKASYIAGAQDDVRTAKILILSGIFQNIRYMMVGYSKQYQLHQEYHFPIAMCKGCLSKRDYWSQ